jgi:hypothetical protein
MNFVSYCGMNGADNKFCDVLPQAVRPLSHAYSLCQCEVLQYFFGSHIQFVSFCLRAPLTFIENLRLLRTENQKSNKLLCGDLTPALLRRNQFSFNNKPGFVK